MAAQEDPLKKPATAYFLWFNTKREEIQQQLGTKSFGEVGKKASEMWKTISAAEKAPFEKTAQEQKDAYDKFITTAAGQKALEEKKAEKRQEKDDKSKKIAEREEKKAQIAEKKAVREEKQAVKALGMTKDEKLKKPTSAYFLWFNERGREQIEKQAGAKDLATVGKKAGEMWKGMKDSERKPFEDKAKAQKDAYETYINSEEGAAALKAYKDEVSAIKSKRAPEPAADEIAAAEPDEPAAKKARKQTKGEAAPEGATAKNARRQAKAGA